MTRPVAVSGQVNSRPAQPSYHVSMRYFVTRGMSMRFRRVLGAVLIPFVAMTGAPAIRVAEAQAPSPAPPPGSTAPAESEPQGLEATPPRVGYITGEVSFWRPGAADWAP